MGESVDRVATQTPPQKRTSSTQPKLSMRQARWVGLFQEYDVYVAYRAELYFENIVCTWGLPMSL